MKDSKELWQQLRPPTLADFVGVGNAFELGSIPPDFRGSVIFTGPWGCGKTSAALALASMIFGGVNISTNQDQQLLWSDANSGSSCVHYANLERSNKRASYVNWILNAEDIVGRRIFILDEAHALTKNMQNQFKASIEYGYCQQQYFFCTPHLDKLAEPLKELCQIVRLGTLHGPDVDALIEHAWATAAPGRPLPESLRPAIEKFQIGWPRAIIDVVSDVARGNSALEAAAKRRRPS